MGPDGRRHISYYDLTNGDLKYARCAASCAAAASWEKGTIRSAGITGFTPSLAVGTNGRVHVSFYSVTGGALFYLSCATNCTTASSWSGALLDGRSTLDAGKWNSLALARNQVLVSYYDETNGNLKYVEHTP